LKCPYNRKTEKRKNNKNLTNTFNKWMKMTMRRRRRRNMILNKGKKLNKISKSSLFKNSEKIIMTNRLKNLRSKIPFRTSTTTINRKLRRDSKK
jgi:hypothetical protein